MISGQNQYQVGIITFNTFGAKQVIRDLSRCMSISLPITDDICKSITSKDLTGSYIEGSKFYRLINSKREFKMLYEIGKHLEGLPRHISIHAAGIVMSRKPIDEIIPLYKNSIGIYTTAYSKDCLEPLGLLKMDFLGIDNLTLISNVIDEIREKETEVTADDKTGTIELYLFSTNGVKIGKLELSDQSEYFEYTSPKVYVGEKCILEDDKTLPEPKKEYKVTENDGKTLKINTRTSI